MAKKIISFILAGGSGTRLAPLSLSMPGKLPKQFLPLLSDKTIFQETIARLPEEVEKIVVSVKKYKDTIKEQGEGRVGVIAEPFPCNTAIAIGLAAIYAKKKTGDENTVIFFNTADHYMNDELFRKYYWTMIDAAEDGKIILMGITPDRPETGLGYIKVKSKKPKDKSRIVQIERFVEKPVLEKAIEFVESGEYFWNSGMFCFTVKTILDKLKKNSPIVYTSLLEIENDLGTEKESETIEREYQKVKDEKANISIDFAVMEHEAENILLVKAEKELRWDDIGLWIALKKYFPEDKNGNVLKGKASFEKSENNLVLNYKKSQDVILKNINDLLIVNSENGILICPQSSSIRASEIVPYIEEVKKEILIDCKNVEIKNATEIPIACIDCKNLIIDCQKNKVTIRKFSKI
jgi:mannose-1-phosphate guanylyltransferase